MTLASRRAAVTGVGTAVAAALLACGPLLTAKALGAEPAPLLGRLFVDPAQGTDATPLTLLTTGGCPAPATNATLRLFGAGFPATGQIVMGNTDAGVAAARPFSVAPADTLRAFAAQQPTPAVLRGSYRLVLTCQEPLEPAGVGRYEGTLVFTSPRAYRADNPARPVVTTTTPGDVPLPGPATGGSGASPGAVPGAPAGVTSARPQGVAAGGSAAVPDAAGLVEPAAANGTDSDVVLAAALGFGAAALLVGLPALLRRRSAGSTGH